MKTSIWSACADALVVLIVSFFFAWSSVVSADDNPLTILITASRFAETVDETLAPVTVITRQDIEQKQVSTVEEVLRTVPGITLGNSGGVGKQTSVFLRGTESNHVLVLIDGVKVGNATSGTTPFEHLPLDQIEKIEVVRGPRSSLYGSEAIGGVIQIFTRKGRGSRAQFSVSAGSHDARKTNFGVSHGERAAWFNLGISTETTDGYDACSGAAGCGVDDETDDDGYKNISTSLRGGVVLSDAVSIEGNFLESESETEFDGSYQNESETVTRIAGVKLTFRGNEKLQSSLSLARSQDQSDNFKDGTPASTFDTTRDQIRWQGDVVISDRSRLIVGTDYLNDAIDSDTKYDEDRRDNIGVFALWRTEVRANDLELSLRNDDNQQFGNHMTGGIAWGRNLDDGARITASYGTAFAAPTFDDLYYPESIYCGRDMYDPENASISSNNPNLDPEQSKSFNLGMAQTGLNSRMAINLFRTEIKDLIAYDREVEYRKVKCFNKPNAMLPVGKSINIVKAEITGVEISGDLRAGAWDLSASATFQKSINAETKADLLKRPNRKLDLDVSHRFGKYRIGANLYSQSDSKDTGNADIDGFATLNLRAEARWHKNWDAEIKINNVTDTDFETAAFYPQDGTNLMATLRYVPD